MKNALTRCLALGLALVFLATASADAGLFSRCGKAKSGVSMKAKFRVQQASAPCGAQQQAATQVNVDVRVRGQRRVFAAPTTSCQGAQCTPSAQSPATVIQAPTKAAPCPNGQCPAPTQAPVIQLFVPVPVSQAPSTPEPSAPGAGLLTALTNAAIGYLEDRAALPPAPAAMQPAAPAKPEAKWYDLTNVEGWYGYGVKTADGSVDVTHWSSKATGEMRSRDPNAPAPPVAAPEPASDPRFGAVGDYYGFTNWLNGVRAQYGLGAVGHDPNLDGWAAVNNNHQNAYGMGHHVMGPARRQNSGMGAAGTVWQMWMASPAHRSALLDPSISWIGIAASGAYWTYNAY